MEFYVTLNRTVIDGTRCVHPVTSTGKTAPSGTLGVCIGGFCKVRISCFFFNFFSAIVYVCASQVYSMSKTHKLCVLYGKEPFPRPFQLIKKYFNRKVAIKLFKCIFLTPTIFLLIYLRVWLRFFGRRTSLFANVVLRLLKFF